jgi:hypothetical protein
VPGDGWQEEYKERVLEEFKMVHRDIEKLGVKIDALKDTDITNMKLAIATMQQENRDSARTSGAIAAVVVSIIVGVVTSVIQYALLHGAK